jgi:hypothetical protein
VRLGVLLIYDIVTALMYTCVIVVPNGLQAGMLLNCAAITFVIWILLAHVCMVVSRVSSLLTFVNYYLIFRKIMNWMIVVIMISTAIAYPLLALFRKHGMASRNDWSHSKDMADVIGRMISIPCACFACIAMIGLWLGSSYSKAANDRLSGK